MIVQEPSHKLAPQKCPFCQQEQDIIFNGHTPTGKDNEVKFDTERGYSFCNCRNIHFTDWANIKQEVYDAGYEKKYQTETVRNFMEAYAKKYLPLLLAPFTKAECDERFLEIGAVSPYLLDAAKAIGYETFALDIISHKFKGHKNIACDFEKFGRGFMYPEKALFSGDNQFEVIWASHIFEHFKDPIEAARKCYDLLTYGGALFVAMPDPFFIDFQRPEKWGHWHLEEHHILWDMDSFIEMMEEVGFTCFYKYRNPGGEFICIGDYHLIFRK